MRQKVDTDISLERGITGSDFWLSVSDVVDEANLHGCRDYEPPHVYSPWTCRFEGEGEILSPTIAYRCCSTYTDSVESATLPRFYVHV